MNMETAIVPKSVTQEEVLSVQHWTDELFSFRLTRPQGFRFKSGEFVMLGLMVDGKPLLRAYSIASPAWDEGLDFYSIKVQDGPLTSRLQKIEQGSTVLLGKKPTGTLVLDALKPGKRLFLFSTGTGIAPFASVLRDPETYEAYDQVVLTHTCRGVKDLAYGEHLVRTLEEDPLIGEFAKGHVVYFPSVTRETSPRGSAYEGRVTDLMRSGSFFETIGGGGLNPADDRIMICGSTAMLNETKEIAEEAGFIEGSNAAPGDFVVEKAFVS